MTTNANTATTGNRNPKGQQRDISRMALAGTPISTSASPPHQRQRQQHTAKPLQTLLSIVAHQQCAQPGTETDLKSAAKLQQENQRYTELRQIELIYRAEGNANLVLALPQFKKVLRLPKMSLSTAGHTNNTNSKIGNTQQQQERQVVDKDGQQHHHQHRQQHQQQETRQLKCQQEQQKQQEVVQSTSDPTVNQNANDLTMEEFVTYIEIIRHLLGNEYVFETDIVRLANEEDIKWINEHIRPYRPAHRRDKEFCGEFGLLLPDATRLPIAFDILLSNLQAKLIGDTYAIEIKPKQGWLLPTNANDLFDVKATRAKAIPTTTATTVPEVEAPTNDKTDVGSARHAEAATSHHARCRYCAMQFLKLHEGKINRRSSYCPIALFSGVPSKILGAINALFDCPQNNLRIFRNGVLIYDDEHNSYEELMINYLPGAKLQLIKDLAVTCLLRDYTPSNNNQNTNRCASNSGVNDDDVANEGEIVKAVSGQPHLSTTPAAMPTTRRNEEAKEFNSEAPIIRTDTHTAAPIAVRTARETARTAARPSATPKEAELSTTMAAQISEVEMLCLPKNCVLQKILHLQLLAKRHLLFMHAAGYAYKSEKSYVALKTLLQRYKQTAEINIDSTLPLEAYLLGATALDCSIMMAFQEISMCNQQPHLQPAALPPSTLLTHCVQLPQYDKTYLTNVTLVDLDPKPDSHFCKYVKQTRQALNYCLNSGC